jgi:hypothetical protein
MMKNKKAKAGKRTKVTLNNPDRDFPEMAVRIIKGKELRSMTAAQLREAISNGENDPIVVRDAEGGFQLLNTLYRGLYSNNYCPQETEVILFADGSFEVIEEKEEEDEDEVEAA